jgi:hypothetical protein
LQCLKFSADVQDQSGRLSEGLIAEIFNATRFFIRGTLPIQKQREK